jgi:hypothetical protein
VIAARLVEYLPNKRTLVIEGGPSDFMDDRVLNLSQHKLVYSLSIAKQCHTHGLLGGTVVVVKLASEQLPAV